MKIQKSQQSVTEAERVPVRWSTFDLKQCHSLQLAIGVLYFNRDGSTMLDCGQPQSNLDVGPVVKLLGITVKKEAGKVVEKSDVVRFQATREFRKGGQEPLEPKMTPKRGPKDLSKF